MHLKDLQKQVHEWISQFEEGYWPPLSMFAALVEEVGELGREINHLEGFKPKKKPTSSSIKEDMGLELADLLFSLICIANHYDLDLETYFLKIIEKYSNRDKDRWTKKDHA